MSGERANLKALIRGAWTEAPRGRWSAQRRLFGRLALGGGASLLLARAAPALGNRSGVQLSAAEPPPKGAVAPALSTEADQLAEAEQRE